MPVEDVHHAFALNFPYPAGLEKGKTLPEVKENYMEPILPITGNSATKEKVLELINNAKENIYLEIWSQDFKQIEKHLLEAYNRNVEVRIVGYDRLQSRFGLIYEHPHSKKLEEYFKGRVVIIVVDNKEACYIKIPTSLTERATGIWTKNEDIVFIPTALP